VHGAQKAGTSTGSAEADDGYEGYLLYIKPSLSGNEPRDVLQYAAAHPEFPHETTSDQWFAESQFESYRKLGYHLAKEVFERAGIREARGTRSDVRRAEAEWYPPSAAVKSAFSRHADQLKILQAAQRHDPELRFLEPRSIPNGTGSWKAGARPIRRACPCRRKRASCARASTSARTCWA
jgi:hypothetical protein